MVLVLKNLPANAGDIRDVDSILGLGRSPEEGCGNPLQYSCLESLMDRGAWRARVHGVAQTQTQLRDLACLRACDEYNGKAVPNRFRLTYYQFQDQDKRR